MRLVDVPGKRKAETLSDISVNGSVGIYLVYWITARPLRSFSFTRTHSLYTGKRALFTNVPFIEK